MAQIDTGHSNLVNAFNTHKKVTGESLSHQMILFYGVECGLKALVCSSSYNSHHSKLSDIILSSGNTATTHKINDLIIHLRLPASLGKCPNVKINKDGQNVDHSEIHQAWRYGIKLDPTLEEQAIKWLKAMVVFLATKL